MDASILRGVTLPKPKYRKVGLSTSLQCMKHYSKLDSTIPPMLKIFDIETVSNMQSILFDNNYIIENIKFTGDNNIKGNCVLEVNYNNKIESVDSYLKVTHLLDPIHILQKKTTPEENQKKIDNYWNQAYVETIASYVLGKLKEEDVTPHFNLFYGGYKAVADKYSYNISDEVESYRMYRWFWDSIEKEEMTIEIEADDEVIKAELLSEIMQKPEFCIETSKNDEVIEELIPVNIDESKELESLDSASIKTATTSSVNNSEDEDENEDDCKVYITLKNFPVMMIFTEKNESTMDDLLEDFKEVGAEIDTEEWESRWTAWLFQVIAGLCVIQTLFKFTHNDLHTNNIVWSKTDIPYLYYQTLNKKVYKVPTYGKIFKIIDFGRSIFSLNEHVFISDDFCEGNDADTQYNFPPLSK